MKIKHLEVSLLCAFLLTALIALPAYAQMGPGGNSGGGNSGAGMGNGMMMQGYGFSQYDGRFNGFGSMTFEEAADTFGIPVEDAISDLELPEDMDTQLTILEIEERYGVSGQEIASYMVMNMQQLNMTLNPRERLLMRQEAVQAMRAGRGYGMYFMRQGNFAYGNFTTFNFNESGAIENFAVGGDLLFDSVEISDFEYLDEQVTETTAFYQGVDSQILIQDSPMGVFQVRALADKTVTYNLAEGVTASLEENISSGLENAIPIKITSGNFEGYLLFFRNPLAENPNASINGTEAEISGDKITVKLVKDSVAMFRASPMQPSLMQTGYRYSNNYTYMNQVLNGEIATGRFGAEIALRAGSDYAPVTSYAPVGLQVRDRDRDRIVLNVESELPDGRVIYVNVDNETINLTNPDRLRLRYDGTVIEEADNIDELFAGGSTPLCYRQYENGTASIAVYIPQFSEHEIIIDLEPEGEEGSEDLETAQDEEDMETGEPIAQDEEEETESSPAFELGFAVTGLAVAYRLKHRK
ncbi:MAST domain-containing protein [Methanosarcina sp. T3]|uniref:MAST domain-containing protein n=1 Tax=Methanosarcina sp. T3 TaxID=3439062 RepID=UPI003F83319B